MLGNRACPLIRPFVADVADAAKSGLQNAMNVSQRLVLGEAEDGRVDALVQLEVGQAIALRIHVHHVIVQLPDLLDLGIRGVFAGEAACKSLKVSEHHEAVMNVLGAELPDHCPTTRRQLDQSLAGKKFEGLRKGVRDTPSLFPRLPS